MNIFEQICKEWLKGCSCSSIINPEECKECTDALLHAIKFQNKRQKQYEIAKNFVEALKDWKYPSVPAFCGSSLGDVAEILKEHVLKQGE